MTDTRAYMLILADAGGEEHPDRRLVKLLRTLQMPTGRPSAWRVGPRLVRVALFSYGLARVVRVLAGRYRVHLGGPPVKLTATRMTS